jgi:uncharacterized membrane protein
LVAVVLVGALAAAWVTALLWRRLDGLGTPAYDLGFFQQVVWHVATTGDWVSSFHIGSFLGLHFSPVLAIPAALQSVVGFDPRVLSLIHAIGIGALVPATFLFLRAAYRPSRLASAVAAGIAIGLPVWATTQWVIRADFHPELAGVVLATLAGWAGLTGRPRAMWLLAAMACLTREDLAYAVAVVGLIVAVRGTARMRMHGRCLVIASVVWGAVVVGVVMPWIRDGSPSDTADYYRWLGDGLTVLTAPFRIPEEIIAALARPAPWFVVAGMLVAVGGMPLWRPAWLLILVPPLGLLLLSGHAPQAAIIYQYPLLLVVPLLVATAMSGRRALAVVARSRRRVRGRPTAWRPSWARAATAVVVTLVAVTPAVIVGFNQGTIPPFSWRDPALVDRPGAIERLNAIAAGVPDDAALVADETLVPPLAARPSVRRLTERGLPAPTAYVLTDRAAWSPSPGAARRRDLVIAWLERTGRPIYADDGRFVLWGPIEASATTMTAR